MTPSAKQRPRAVLLATAVVVVVSAAVALAASWPIREGPPGTTCLVALLAFGISLMVGVPASEPLLRRASALRDAAPWQAGLQPGPWSAPVPPREAGPPASPDPVSVHPVSVHPVSVHPVSVHPAEPAGSGRAADRCFGCLRLEEVAGTGLLTVDDSTVPLHLCHWCLEHLESWHARETARLRAG